MNFTPWPVRKQDGFSFDVSVQRSIREFQPEEVARVASRLGVDSLAFGPLKPRNAPPALTLTFFLGSLIPYLALWARRLHDIGKSGWSAFVLFVPFVGFFILLAWFCRPSVPERNDAPVASGLGTQGVAAS